MSLTGSASLALALFVALTFVDPSRGHTYHLGSCPTIEPVHSFDMDKFLGKWYVTFKTSTASSCLYNNYTKTGREGEYLLEQVSKHFAVGLTSVDHKYRYTGELKVKDRTEPAKMTVKFPLSVAGTAQYTVFMTDYENYAAVFSCQRLAFAHRQSASILSRTPGMDKMYLDKVRARMSSVGIDPFSLSVIDQKDCDEITNPDGYNFNIDPDTLSAGNIAGVVRKAGEKIGDGIETVANKFTGEAKSKNEETKVAPDSEWLP